MTLRNLIGLLFVFHLCGCSDGHPKQSPEHYGTSITNSARRGRMFKDSTGTNYFYCYITTTITNDSLIPMNLKIALSKDYYQPTPTNGERFKVFLQDSSVLCNRDITKILSEPNFTFNKVINPQEECPIYIGFLADSVSELSPIPFALFSKGHKPWLGSIPDSAVNQAPTKKNQLDLLLALGFSYSGPDSLYSRYSLIRCGEISFSNK